MHHGAHIPPDHSKGDETTVGGYAAVHARPVAFEAIDGASYSVELCAEETGDAQAPWGGYILFLKWRRVGEPGVEGHLETSFITHAADEASAIAALGRMPLASVKATLDTLVRKSEAGVPRRKWWDVMQEDDDGRA